MPRLADLGYALAALVGLPVWLPRMIRTGKIRTDWRARMGRVSAPVLDSAEHPRLLFHAVSVGEVNAIRELVAALEAEPDPPRIIVAAATDTGVARARDLFEPAHVVVRYPLDFSFAVERFLEAVQPDQVALVELEVWPNFTAACARRGIPVGVVNGRLTERSFHRYQLVRGLIRPAFRRLAFVGAQNEAYAARFAGLGVSQDRIHITGTMKWDTARTEDTVAGAEALAEEMGIDRSRPLVVAGSTAPGEHELLIDAMPEGVQLLCAPRKPEWFDQAAEALGGCARRSRGDRGSESGRFLLDTIGELRQAYALADLVVVGRTFVDLGGSDMIEPVALGKATVVGPHVSNFRDVAEALLAGDGLLQIERGDLRPTLARWLPDEPGRRALAERGRAVIRARQGATCRTLSLLRQHLRKSN